MSHVETRTYSDESYESLGVMGCWGILLDIANAVRYEFTQNRLPEPGRAIDVAEAEAHITNIEKEWSAEKIKRDFCNRWAPAPSFSTMPLNAKLYLHSVLRDEWNCSMGEPVEPVIHSRLSEDTIVYPYLY